MLSSNAIALRICLLNKALSLEILLDIYLGATQYNQKEKPSQETVDRHYQIQADFVDALVQLFKENK